MGRTASGYDNRIFQMHLTQDLNERLQEMRDHMENNSRFSQNYWKQRARIAVDLLLKADPADGEAWYDDAHNVPTDSTPRQIYYLCYAQIVKLTGSFPSLKSTIHRGVLVWDDHKTAWVFSKEVGKNDLHWNEFSSRERAQDWLDGLEWAHLGYGVVLDVVNPVDMESE